MGTYKEFIDNILVTRGRFSCGAEYHERHHIIPRCLDGSDDDSNLIDLYAHEHFIAHKLLAIENPENEKLIYAWHCMAFMSSKNQERYEITPEEYEEAKIAFIASISGENAPFYGKHHSEESRQKLSELAKNRFKDKTLHPRYGKHMSTESKNQSSKSHQNPSEETREKMRRAWKTRAPISEITREKLKQVTSGKNNPRARMVYCLELDECFWGAKEAEEKYGVCRSSISQCCNGKLGHAGLHPITGEKLHWKFINLENNI